MIALHRALAISILSVASVSAMAQSAPSNSGVFVLHKFAKAIGKETYSITKVGDEYTLTSDFLFTDRGSPVPLKSGFTAKIEGMVPVNYSTKGRVSRQTEIDETMRVRDTNLTLTREKGGETTSYTLTPTGPWFITDGYSPVAMQEQMMRWWLSHNKPAEFTVYPAATKVHIAPAETLTLDQHAAHGYTVSGLIWGQETLWMDDATDLVALVSTDAEFDHFEAVREPYATQLSTFISAAVKANLKELGRLNAVARMPETRKLAIVGATLEDSTGAPAVKDSVIVIADGVITAVGSRSEVKVPIEATVLDATGKFAVPGLWDMHAHYEQVEWGPIYLAAGVTSVRDCGNEFDFIRTVHDELDRKQNPAVGPHLEFAGIIDGTGKISLGAVIADTPEQAEAWVQRYKDAGAKQIKIYSSVKPEIVRSITAAAHKHGMTVTGHIPEGMTAMDGIADGMDQINHITYDVPYFVLPATTPDGKPDQTKLPVFDPQTETAKAYLKTLQEHHIVLDPTVAIFESYLHTKPFQELEPGITHVAPQLREALESPALTGDRAVSADRRWANMMGTLRALHAARIPIVAGTDQAIPGYSLHRELELYVEAGFTPLEALQAATLVAAKAVGVEKESGSLEVGKRGDVLLLDADPMEDIHNTRKVWKTVAAGAVYDPAPLWQSVDFKP